VTAAGAAAGEAISASAPELARLWRAMRLHARRRTAAGLLDGIVADLLVRIGDGLAAGGDPAAAWSGVAGAVRLDARDPDRSRAQVDAEWDALESVLDGAGEALAAGDDVRAWIAQALAAARAGARTLGERGGPSGVVVVWSFGEGSATPGPGGARR
jgi:hypothetical protein